MGFGRKSVVSCSVFVLGVGIISIGHSVWATIIPGRDFFPSDMAALNSAGDPNLCLIKEDATILDARLYRGEVYVFYKDNAIGVVVDTWQPDSSTAPIPLRSG